MLTRSVRFQLPADTSLFTPTQLQPAAACRIAFNAGARWLSEHLVSQQQLISEFHTGFVLWAGEIEYSAPPPSFFDGDCLTCASPDGFAVRVPNSRPR